VTLGRGIDVRQKANKNVGFTTCAYPSFDATFIISVVCSRMDLDDLLVSKHRFSSATPRRVTQFPVDLPRLYNKREYF